MQNCRRYTDDTRLCCRGIVVGRPLITSPLEIWSTAAVIECWRGKKSSPNEDGAPGKCYRIVEAAL